VKRVKPLSNLPIFFNKLEGKGKGTKANIRQRKVKEAVLLPVRVF